MKTIQVIRFEHPEDGFGIFLSPHSDSKEPGDIIDKFNDKHGEFKLPCEDGLKLNSRWFCAFKSIDQVKQWVTTDEIAVFKARGFIIWMLEVSEYQQGEYQVIYTKESIINKTDISSIF